MQWKVLAISSCPLQVRVFEVVIREYLPGAELLHASGEANWNFPDSVQVDMIFTFDTAASEFIGYDALDSVSCLNAIQILPVSTRFFNAVRAQLQNYLPGIPVNQWIVSIWNRISVEDYTDFEDGSTNYLMNKVLLSHSNGLRSVTLIDIVYLEAQNSYTILTLSGGEKIISSKPIRKFEMVLKSKWFFRIHKSYVINFFHLKEYISRKGSSALMDNGDQLLISRYRTVDFLQAIQDVFGNLKI